MSRNSFPGGTGDPIRNEAYVTTAVATSTPLTAADRCDRCGAQAYLRVELLTGGELLFCAHHAREHGDALKEVAATRVDETNRLAAERTGAPADPERCSEQASTAALDESPGPPFVCAPFACGRVTAVTGVEVLVALAIAVGLAGILVPILPGSILILGGVLVWAVDVGGTTAWAVFAVVAAILVVGGVVKYLVPNRRLKSVGVPSSTQWAGAAVGIVGFFVIPVVGLFLGFVVGVYAAERHRVGRDAWPSTKAALRAGGLSILIEMVAGLAATLVWVGGVLAT